MAAASCVTDTGDWRSRIVSQLQTVCQSQCSRFQDIITSHNHLLEKNVCLENDIKELTKKNEQLRVEKLELERLPAVSLDRKPNERIQALEQKLLLQQEELTELHRRKGDNAQQLLDLNYKLQEKEKQVKILEDSLAERVKEIMTLRMDIQRYQTRIKDLETINQVERDEHQALQITFCSLEEKLKKTQEENFALVERLMRYKSKDADKLNEENENFVRKRQAKLQKELEDAARDSRAISPDRLREGAGPFISNALPTKCTAKFDAHDGEVHAVRWSPSDRPLVATGGADRKVKLWDISKTGQYENRGMLVGSSAGVMSVDYDSSGTNIVAASSDFACRVWTVEDKRMRHTLTGHSGKVMTAKFLGEPTKVVTGSYDRTLKIWDLRSKSCIETKFVGSSCNDVVTLDGSGSTIISGHVDKRVRFWDTRAERTADEVELTGKVTSLDLSRDNNYLLACARDNTLRILDLRMKQVIGSFSADEFKVGCDWSRAAFSPDGQFVAAGSADGAIFVWTVKDNKLEIVLKEHTAAVTAVSFYPQGSFLMSVDVKRKAVLWADV